MGLLKLLMLAALGPCGVVLAFPGDGRPEVPLFVVLARGGMLPRAARPRVVDAPLALAGAG